MISINANWKAAFSQEGVEPIVHVKILALSTPSTDTTCDVTSGSPQIACDTTAALVEGMSVVGTGIPANSYILSIDEPDTVGGTGTKFTISANATQTSTNTTLTFYKSYEMTTRNFNRRYLSDRHYADPIITNVVPISMSLDHWSREPQVGELNVEVEDEGTIRRLGTLGYVLKNKAVEVRVGAPGLAFTDYQLVFRGEVLDILPSDGVINIKIRDLLQKVIEGVTRKPWYNDHPLTVIKEAVEYSGVHADNIDSDSFDPDNSAAASFGHYCVTSYVPWVWSRGIGHIYTPSRISNPVDGSFNGEGSTSSLFPHANGRTSVPVEPIVKELARSMYGYLEVSMEGKLKFKRYDPTSSVVQHFTVNDYGDFRQDSNHGEIINDLHMTVGFGDNTREFRIKNAASITKYGTFDKKLGSMPYSATLTHAFLSSLDPEFATGDTSLNVFSGQTNGLSGTRGAIPGPQGTNATVSASRPLYLLNKKEIIKCTSVSTEIASSPADQLVLPIFNNDGTIDITSDAVEQWEAAPNKAALSSMTRGFGSTTAESITRSETVVDSDGSSEYDSSSEVGIDWWVNPLWDITMLYDFATTVLDRYQDGLPSIQFTTPLSHFGIEIGDFITIDNEEFLHLAKDGLDNTTTWEVVGKEAVFFGDNIGITFKCVLANLTAVTYTLIPPVVMPISLDRQPDTLGDDSMYNTVGGNSVIKGLTVSTNSSSNDRVDITAGAYSLGGITRRLEPLITPALPASKDCYIGIDSNGFPTVSAVANGAAAPGTSPNETRIAKVVTATAPSTVAELLLHFDDDVTDDSGNSRNGTATSAVAYTTSGAGGSGASGFDKAISFNNGGTFGSGNDAKVTFSDFSLGTDDFTIEFWWWYGSNAGVAQGSQKNSMLSTDGGATATGGFELRHYDAFSPHAFQINQWDGSALERHYLETGSLTYNTWYHVAIVRESGDFRLYIGEAGDTTGDYKDSSTGTARAWGGNGDDIHVGQLRAGSADGAAYWGYYLDGNLDEFRIKKDASIYTGTGTYTLPTSPYADGGSGGAATVSSVTDLRTLGSVTSKNISNDLNYDNRGIPNSGFEIWSKGPTYAPDSWNYNKTTGSFQDQWGQGLVSRTGRFSLQALPNGTASATADVASNLFPIESDTHYEVSIEAYSGSSDETFWCFFEEFSSVNGTYSTRQDLGKGSLISVGSAATWSPKVLHFTTASASRFGRVRIARPTVSGSVGDDSIYFDCVKLKKIPPYFSVTKTDDQDITANADGTGTLVTWSSEEKDINGVFDLANDKFIAPRDGIYTFRFGVLYDQYGASYPSGAYFGFYKTSSSGNAYVRKEALPEVASTVNHTVNLHLDNISLLKGDEITVRFYFASGHGVTVKGTMSLNCYFYGREEQ